jgi:transposase, IS30 family
MPCRARLTRDQREVIERELERDPEVSWAQLARLVGVTPTTVAREVRANRGRYRYNAEAAQVGASRRARRPKTPKLCEPGPLRDRVTSELKAKRSPWAICADIGAEGGPSLCHETVYQAVYDGMLDVKARECLRWRRPRRRHRQARHLSKRAGLPNISTRPAVVNDRSELGHWELDLIIGARNQSALLAGLERVTRYASAVTLPNGYTAGEVLGAMVELFDPIPAHLRRSVTFDQGNEWGHWETLEATYGLKAWFCDPHSPWQRGATENLNGHLRFWFPRGTRLDIVTPTEAARVVGLLNGQRRRSLDGDSPEGRWIAAGGVPLTPPAPETRSGLVIAGH